MSQTPNHDTQNTSPTRADSPFSLSSEPTSASSYESMRPAPSPPPRQRGKDTTIIAAILAVLITIGGTIFSTTAYNNLHNTSIANSIANSTATVRAVMARATQTANTQATARAILLPDYPFSKNLVLNDPLKDNSHVGQYGWDVNDSCIFSGGAYHAIEKRANSFNICAANTPIFSNFTFQVQMTIQTGGAGAAGGIIFRADPGSDKFYALFLDAQGNYVLDMLMGSGTDRLKLKSGRVKNTATVHTISIVATGTSLTLYVDLIEVNQAADSTYFNGKIGVLSSYGKSTTDVAYTNAKVWLLP